MGAQRLGERIAGDRQIQDLQRSVERGLRGVATGITQGKLLEDIDVGVTETRVAHTLLRRWAGWIVVDSSAAATVHATKRSSEADADKYVYLQASAATTVKLWVF